MNKELHDEKQFELLTVKCREGCPVAQNELAKFIGDEFYGIAQRLCGKQPFADSLPASDLLNETFLRLVKAGVFRDPRSRNYIYTAAGKTMRNVLVDYLRRRNTKKRDPGRKRVYLEQLIDSLQEQPYSMEELNDALDELHHKNPFQSEVVHLKYFFGMTMSEVAERLQSPLTRVELEWRRARVWLYEQLYESASE